MVFEHVTDLRGKRWPGSVVVSDATTWHKIAVSFDMFEDSLDPGAVLKEAVKHGQSPP